MEETVQNVLQQIEDKQCVAVLTAWGIAENNIRKYGVAFKVAFGEMGVALVLFTLSRHTNQQVIGVGLNSNLCPSYIASYKNKTVDFTVTIC